MFVIIADDEVDQECETIELAKREKRDLVAMGCTVKIIALSKYKLKHPEYE